MVPFCRARYFDCKQNVPDYRSMERVWAQFDYVAEQFSWYNVHTNMLRELRQGNIYISDLMGEQAVNPAQPTPFPDEDILDMFTYGDYRYGKEE